MVEMIMDIAVKSSEPVVPVASADVKSAAGKRAAAVQAAAVTQARTEPAESAIKVAPVREPTSKELGQAVAEVRKAVEIQAPNQISFSVDDESGRSVVRIIDQKTGATIRQIPSQEMLDIAKSIDKMQGLLFKETA
jgi:flagellar protein FlaG